MNKVLNLEQKDFICRQLAQFVPHKKIADIFLEHFPETKMGKDHSRSSKGAARCLSDNVFA